MLHGKSNIKNCWFLKPETQRSYGSVRWHSMVNKTNMVACSYRMVMLWVLTLVLGCTLTVHAQVPSFWGCPEKNIPMPVFDVSRVSTLNQRKVKSKPVATKYAKCCTNSAFWQILPSSASNLSSSSDKFQELQYKIVTEQKKQYFSRIFCVKFACVLYCSYQQT
jgi:hypothetical protein